MTIDSIKQRLLEEIRERGIDDKFIDQNEEREILQIAIHQGIEIDQAKLALRDVCQSEGFSQESDLRSFAIERCTAVIERSGSIDRSAFDAIVESMHAECHGSLAQRDLKRLVVTAMEDHGLNRVKAGWLTNWYAAAKREAGLA